MIRRKHLVRQTLAIFRVHGNIFVVFHSTSHINLFSIPKSKPKSTRVLEISKQQADQAFTSCLEMVRRHDVDSYLAILTMNKAAQPEVVAVSWF